MNRKVPLALMSVDEIREVFARDDEIDKQERDKMAALMGWNEEEECSGRSVFSSAYRGHRQETQEGVDPDPNVDGRRAYGHWKADEETQ